MGVRWGARLQTLLTIIKVGAIGIIVVALFFFAKGRGDVANFVDPKPGSFDFGLLGAFGVGLVASLWAYKGWEAATYSAGETKNPQKNLPLGILIGTIVVIVLYILANLAYMYILPVGKIASSEGRVALDAMALVTGPFGASLIAFLILFSILGAANQNMLTSPRVYYAMAQDGLFFKKVADVHPKFLTPHVSIIAITLWSILLTLTGTFQQLFTYVIFGEWIFFGLTVAAVDRAAEEAARPAPALQDLGLPRDADHLRPGGALCLGGLAPQRLQERHGRTVDHLPGHPGVPLLEGEVEAGVRGQGLSLQVHDHLDGPGAAAAVALFYLQLAVGDGFDVAVKVVALGPVVADETGRQPPGGCARRGFPGPAPADPGLAWGPRSGASIRTASTPARTKALASER